MRLWPRREGSSLDLLVVGLGNPGREHERNRHNAGWLVLDELARRHDGSWRTKHKGQVADIRIEGHKLALLKPETYMNESGRSVSAAAQFFKVDLGRLELKFGGGLAGHNGLRSIAQHLKTPDFLRLRIGVGRPARGDKRPLADYVLSNFELHDNAQELIGRAADAVEQLDADGLERAQSRVNRRA
jgi:peptidyl-tRNA hydrolase, PTH1 family